MMAGRDEKTNVLRLAREDHRFSSRGEAYVLQFVIIIIAYDGLNVLQWLRYFL